MYPIKDYPKIKWRKAEKKVDVTCLVIYFVALVIIFLAITWIISTL